MARRKGHVTHGTAQQATHGTRDVRITTTAGTGSPGPGLQGLGFRIIQAGQAVATSQRPTPWRLATACRGRGRAGPSR